jgi:hypothetical protein
MNRNLRIRSHFDEVSLLQALGSLLLPHIFSMITGGKKPSVNAQLSPFNTDIMH